MTLSEMNSLKIGDVVEVNMRKGPSDEDDWVLTVVVMVQEKPFGKSSTGCTKLVAANINGIAEILNNSSTRFPEDWEEVHSSESEYSIYRKMLKDEDGKLVKGLWKAKNNETNDIFDITYNQAIGYEPINKSSVKLLSRKLGEIFLPH